MGKKVLIIEDDADSRFLLEELLSLAGHESRSAESLAEADEILQQDSSLDVILTDLGVPGAPPHGGIVPRLRQQLSRTDVKIVITSGHADLASIAKTHGVSYLAKPYSIDSVLSSI